MATWPSGTKASTDNLDSGTDKPSLARADIKQNVDNVNSIIDMFNISGPSDNQILKYNTSNSRFELASDATGSGGYTSIVGVGNIIVTETSAGGVDISFDTTPDIGTPSAGNLSNCTVDGTNPIGYRDLPAVGTKTTSYTLATGDVGKYVQVGSGGSITIPDATFAEGDVILVANNHSAAITITCSITDAYIAGTDTDKATVSLATRGVASIVFLSGTRCIISGNIT